MTESATQPPATTAPVAGSNGAEPQVGQWADLPPAQKRNGPNSQFAPELNATARESEQNPGKARIISMQKSVRSASGRASTIKRKLRKGQVNGLEFPPENFEIIPRGSAVYAVYREPKAAAAKAEPKTAASGETKREAKPDQKPGAKK